MEHRYVRIEAAKPNSPPDSNSSTGTAPLPPKRRRTGVTLACDVCRRKKIRCEGSRPSCTSCLKASVQCKYSERGLVEAENARDASTLEKLRNLPSSEAGRLFEAIRVNDQENSPETFPSLNTVLWSYLAPSRNKLEFELMVRHPVSYPPLFPLQATTLPLESLLRPSRIIISWQEPDSSPSSQRIREVKTRCFPPRPLVDERLRDLQITNWTSVRVSNDLAANILSLYIEIDYQILPMFNLELFLDDILSNKPYFCSKFLVNALFSWICQAYSAINPEAHELGRAFFAEAKQHAHDGPQLVTLTAVSAFQFMCLAAIGNGQDRVGLDYLRKGVKIGTQMGLFGRASEKETASAWLGNQDEWRRCASYTAWGVHNWVSLYSFRYRVNEMIEPPRIPMPGTLEVGPPMERIGNDEASIHTKIFQACCELWVLCHDIRRLRGQPASMSFEAYNETEVIFLRYLSWAESLPLDLVRCEESGHGVAMMHIYFHIMIVDMFLEASQKSEEPMRIRTFETTGITPRAIYAASVSQLKRLLLAYRLTYETACLSILPQSLLVYVSNAVLQEADESGSMEWHFYLMVCLAAMEDLFGSYREAWSNTMALLSMSLKRGAIGPDDARRIKAEMVELGRHHLGPTNHDAHSMMDLELAITDPIAARVHNLAEELETLLLISKGK